MTKTIPALNKRNMREVAMLQKFGENLRKIREKQGYSQEQIAYEAGFSRSYYTEIETGKRNISLLNILKLSSLLQIEVHELIKLKDIPKK